MAKRVRLALFGSRGMRSMPEEETPYQLVAPVQAVKAGNPPRKKRAKKPKPPVEKQRTWLEQWRAEQEKQEVERGMRALARRRQLLLLEAKGRGNTHEAKLLRDKLSRRDELSPVDAMLARILPELEASNTPEEVSYVGDEHPVGEAAATA